MEKNGSKSALRAFMVIEENKKADIPQICAEIFQYSMWGNLLEEKKTVDELIKNDEEWFMCTFLNKLPCPFTLIYEPYYIDRSFRDTYYMYFSNQHFKIERSSKRLSVVLGAYDWESYFSGDEEIRQKIEGSYVGSFVINPLVAGELGRTIVSPKYLIGKDEGPVYIRLAEFKTNIYGKKLQVNAFPYRMQDGETMTCAEVVLLNLLEYYATRYDDYKLIVPSEITESEKRSKYERALPSTGLWDTMLTRIFSEFGFFPRMYDIKELGKEKFKRLLHYYMESGIPVAVNLYPVEGGIGHSVACIGHGKFNAGLEKKIEENENTKFSAGNHRILNSADFYDEYVIVDDNKPVYSIRKFGRFADGMKEDSMVAPLYKHMFMEASQAYDVVSKILIHEDYGIERWAEGVLNDKEDIVIRFFMASSASFKRFRIETLVGLAERVTYASIPMPRFVWVCELYRKEEYLRFVGGEDVKESCSPDDLGAFAEIVIDATASARSMLGGLLLMHYPGKIAYREPGNTKGGNDNFFLYKTPDGKVDIKADIFDSLIKYEIPDGKIDKIKGFRNNLEEIAGFDRI